MSEQTDRELLELAAKAARAPVFGWFNWSPLTDDGDALRLAVKLGIAIEFDEDSVWANDSYQLFEWAEHNGDALSATRRAIVRAAAEIGERTFSTAAHVRQATPSPADPGVGGELLRKEG